MKVSNGWKKLVRNASLNSILGGGMSVPVITLHKMDEHIEVTVRVPGLDTENLFVEIQGEKVVVYRMLELLDEFGKSKQERFVVHWFPITEDIDFKNVHAYQEDNILRIILPLEEHFDDLTNSNRIEEND